MRNINQIVSGLLDNPDIKDSLKIAMLENWRKSLIERNENRIMDKETIARHFEWLGLLDDAILGLTETITPGCPAPPQL